MKYELYIDVFFLTNCFVDFIALMFTKEILHKKTGNFRLFLGSMIASGISLGLFLFLSSYSLYQLLIHFVLNPLMLLFCFKIQEKRAFLEEWAISYMVLLLLGGIMQWLYVEVFGQRYFLLCIGVSGLIFLVFSCFFEHWRRITGKIYPVKILHEGKEIRLWGYYDSGNLLTDPFLKEPVSIASRKEIVSILPRDIKIRLVPFSSLGAENGLIPVCTVEKMIVYQGKKEIVITPAVFGIAREELFQDLSYQVILNEKILRC